MYKLFFLFVCVMKSTNVAILFYIKKKPRLIGKVNQSVIDYPIIEKPSASKKLHKNVPFYT